PRFAREAAAAFIDKYDCLHCGDLFPQALNGVLLSRLFHLPLLVYCHGDEISQTDKRRYQPRVRDFIYHHADMIISANQFAYDGLARIGVPAERLHKLTPGVNLELFHSRTPNRDLVEQYGLRGAKVLLTVARLVPRKGHKIVLEALPKVMREVPNLKYLIAGDGPERTSLHALVRQLGLQKVVVFAGDVPHHRICDLYNLCDVSIMVNRLEPGGDIESFGMVFTEANAMGKPVIAGRSGGTSEAVIDGKTGFLVDPDDVNEVAAKLLLLLKEEEFAKNMGATGRDRVLKDFNWHTRAAMLREISASLVMRSRKRLLASNPEVKGKKHGVSV
ncbi:MAG: glycosyltransferase family 4 protein, partial [Candidatus Angelobacter sp.]